MYKERLGYVIRKQLVRFLWVPWALGGFFALFVFVASNISKSVFGGKFGSFDPSVGFYAGAGIGLAALSVVSFFSIRSALRKRDGGDEPQDVNGVGFEFQQFRPVAVGASNRVSEAPSTSRAARSTSRWSISNHDRDEAVKEDA